MEEFSLLQNYIYSIQYMYKLELVGVCIVPQNNFHVMNVNIQYCLGRTDCWVIHLEPKQFWNYRQKESKVYTH